MEKLDPYAINMPCECCNNDKRYEDSTCKICSVLKEINEEIMIVRVHKTALYYYSNIH